MITSQSAGLTHDVSTSIIVYVKAVFVVAVFFAVGVIVGIRWASKEFLRIGARHGRE